jgi:hypothetical protein
MMTKNIFFNVIVFSRHFLLQWTNSDTTTKSQEFLYIDAFNRGSRMTADEVRGHDDHNDSPNNITIATPVEVKANKLVVVFFF